MNLRNIRIKVNGIDYELMVKPTETLLDILREKLNLVGTKKGCETGECGACIVLINNRSVNSCLVLAVESDGGEILTIEGLAGKDGTLHPIQKAFIEEGAIQCGYCTPGMILSAKALLDRNPDPSDIEIKEALVGNLCRCTGYIRIVKAIRAASCELRG